MTYFHAFILAVTEGITEFLPISSTGHMILVDWFLGTGDIEFTKFFVVNIQLGAIFSVLVLYSQRFFQSFDFYIKLFFAFLPALFLGALFGEMIDSFLENPVFVGITLFLGGVILLFVDVWFSQQKKEDIEVSDAFKIGLFQCLSLFPGVSRSASTIVGAMALGVRRTIAAEFSFFLAVPTLLGATIYQFLKTDKTLLLQHWDILLFGNIVAFFVALIAIRGFVSFLQTRGFRIFGWYRIFVGILVFVFYFFQK